MTTEVYSSPLECSSGSQEQVHSVTASSLLKIMFSSFGVIGYVWRLATWYAK